jgi:hypothetical protein
MTVTNEDIERYVREALNEYADDYDVRGIANDLGIVNLDALQADDFWPIVAGHEK